MNDEVTIERFLQFFRVIRQHWKVVALSAVLVAALFYAIAQAQPDQYQASASLLFRSPASDQNSAYAARKSSRETQTNIKLVSLDVLARRAAQTLGGDFTPGELLAKIDVAAKGRSGLVAVTAHDASSRTAARIANAWTNAYIAFRREADRAKISEAQRRVEGEAATRSNEAAPRQRSLVEWQEQLALLPESQTGKAELAQPAVPSRHATSPKPLRDGLIGGALGLLLGVFGAVNLSRLDRRLKSAEEATAIYRRPLIGLVPASRTLASVHDARELAPSDAETFRMLRANLRYFKVDQELRSVVITSAAPGDGRSTIASQLAVAAAKAGTSSLLVECDLRRPSLRQRLRHVGTSGLTEYLAGSASFSGVIESIPVSHASDDHHSAALLDVAFAGLLPPNPTNLLESHRMAEFLDEAESYYDFVVVDTSPANIVSDSIPLLKRASGVLIAIRLGKTTKDESETLRARLDNLGIDVLGVVVNGVKAEGSGYGYRYRGYQPVGA